MAEEEEEEEVKGGWTLIDGPLTNPFSCQAEEGVLLDFMYV